jgi:hypothetical protein
MINSDGEDIRFSRREANSSMKVGLEAEGGRYMLRMIYEQVDIDVDENLELFEVEADTERHCDSKEENVGKITGFDERF